MTSKDLSVSYKEEAELNEKHRGTWCYHGADRWSKVIGSRV